jgi:hypothetical protein
MYKNKYNKKKGNKMIRIKRTRILNNEMIEFEDVYYDFKDVVLDDVSMCLKSMGRVEHEVNNCVLDIDELIENVLLTSESFIYFDDIETVEEYEEFKDELIEYLKENY